MTLINVLLIVSSDVAQRTPLPYFSIALQMVFVNTSTCGIYGWPAIHTQEPSSPSLLHNIVLLLVFLPGLLLAGWPVTGACPPPP